MAGRRTRQTQSGDADQEEMESPFVSTLDDQVAERDVIIEELRQQIADLMVDLMARYSTRQEMTYL